MAFWDELLNTIKKPKQVDATNMLHNKANESYVNPREFFVDGKTPTKDRLVDEADAWGKFYQTEQDSDKMVTFDENVEAYDSTDPSKITEHTQHMVNNLDVLGDVFGNDKFDGKGIDIDKLSESVYQTGLHESRGGQEVFQRGGGPGRGYYQVEPNTARNILSSFTRMGPKAITTINNILGTNFKNRQEASGMSDKDMEKLLLDARGGTLFAGAKYLQASSASKDDYFLK